MKTTLTPNLKLLIFQVLLTVLLFIPLKNASANTITSVEQAVNTYMDHNDHPLNLVKELDLSKSISHGEKLVEVSLKAQGLSSEASITLIVNGEPVYKVSLSDRSKNINLKLQSKVALKQLSLRASAAFISVAKADLVSDEPQVDDFSHTVR
jgi:hypothetical protein